MVQNKGAFNLSVVTIIKFILHNQLRNEINCAFYKPCFGVKEVHHL